MCPTWSMVHAAGCPHPNRPPTPQFLKIGTCKSLLWNSLMANTTDTILKSGQRSTTSTASYRYRLQSALFVNEKIISIEANFMRACVPPVLHPSGNPRILKNRDSFEWLEPHPIPWGKPVISRHTLPYLAQGVFRVQACTLVLPLELTKTAEDFMSIEGRDTTLLKVGFVVPGFGLPSFFKNLNLDIFTDLFRRLVCPAAAAAVSQPLVIPAIHCCRPSPWS